MCAFYLINIHWELITHRDGRKREIGKGRLLVPTVLAKSKFARVKAFVESNSRKTCSQSPHF